MPLVTAGQQARRRVVAGADAAARAAGLAVGMPLAEAQALCPNLAVYPADPDGDAAALDRLAGWCLRYAPLTALDPPDGLWIDITGAAHLFGGERRMLRDLTTRLTGQGLAARAAVADTPGAAWALARYGDHTPDGSLPSLPIEALRLPAETIEGLRLLGLERIAQLDIAPRAPLVQRFGPRLAARLDQIHGRLFEPIHPHLPAELAQARQAFPEPLLTPEAFTQVIGHLARTVCAILEAAGQGARRLDLLFHRVDGSIQTLRVGTARPTRDPRHLGRMLEERLERVDPGLGVEAMQLVVPHADALAYAQAHVPLNAADAPPPDIAPLVDRLGNRLGETRVFRAQPVQSDVPERSVRRVAPLAPGGGAGWPADLPRPVRLLDPPQPVETMALLPDYPPIAFTWRRVRHRVRHADGPERVAGEWWKRDGEMRSVRDYFRVEDEEGRRFWLFRRGDGEETSTGDRRWFLHGFF